MTTNVKNSINNNLLIEDNKSSGWMPYLTTLGISTVGGSIIGGLPGGVIGLTSSIVDEYLINKQLIDKHYISTSNFWYTTVLTPVASLASNFIPSLKTPIHITSYGLSAAASYFLNDFLNFKNKFETYTDSFLILKDFFDEKQIISSKELNRIYSSFFESPTAALNIIKDDIKEIYNNKFLSSIAISSVITISNIMCNWVYSYYLAKYTGNLFLPSLFSNNNLITQGELIKKGSIIIGAKLLNMFISHQLFQLDYENSKNFYNLILDKSTEITIHHGNKILNKEKENEKENNPNKGKEILENLFSDLNQLLDSGVYGFSKFFQEISSPLLAINYLSKYAPDAFAPSIITLIPLQKFLEILSTKITETNENLNQIKVVKSNLIYEITNKIEQIDLRNGKDYIKDKYLSTLVQQNELTKNLEYFSNIQSYVNALNKLVDAFIDILFYGRKLINNQFALDQVPLIKSSTDDLYSFFLSNINFEIENKDLMISKNRINKLLEILSSSDKNNLVRTINNEDKIIFSNYKLTLDNKDIVTIDYLELEYGNHYAITGKSGCGKTSTLIDLKQGVTGSLSSSGEISFGNIDNKYPKITFIDQNIYLPSESTLLETIYFPNILHLLSNEEIADLKLKATNLLKELEIDGFINDLNNENGLISRLDKKNFKLSGGQASKISIIQAILNKSDILIMDETFASLDRESLIKVEQIINKYLPNILILSIDHQAINNNYNQFYDMELHFGNSTVIQKQIASKRFDENIHIVIDGIKNIETLKLIGANLNITNNDIDVSNI